MCTRGPRASTMARRDGGGFKKRSLLDDDEHVEIKVNTDFARKYEERKKMEELSQCAREAFCSFHSREATGV